LTLDAATGWAFASLDEEQSVVVGNPVGDPGWDIGFNATRVMLNGGAAGPGGVAGWCLCQNVAASEAEIVGFTPTSEQPDFEAVTAADIPEDAEFQLDALVPAVHDWHTGAGATAVAVPSKAWLLRLQDGTSLAKLRIVSLSAPTAEHAGQVTIEYALQPAADQAFEPTQTVTLDASSPASLDLNTGSTTPPRARGTSRSTDSPSGSTAVSAEAERPRRRRPPRTSSRSRPPARTRVPTCRTTSEGCSTAIRGTATTSPARTSSIRHSTSIS
jgi:hypothetical protein